MFRWKEHETAETTREFNETTGLLGRTFAAQKAALEAGETRGHNALRHMMEENRANRSTACPAGSSALSHTLCMLCRPIWSNAIFAWLSPSQARRRASSRCSRISQASSQASATPLDSSRSGEPTNTPSVPAARCDAIQCRQACAEPHSRDSFGLQHRDPRSAAT